jgi:hypothetical protein
MRKRKWLAAGGSLLAASIGLFGSAAAASASAASPVVGYTYIDGNTTANTIDGFPARRRVAHRAGRFPVRRRGRWPGHGAGLSGRDSGDRGRQVPAGGGRRQ